MKSLGIIDYIIFIICLSASFAISIYFACFGKKTNSKHEYLYGSKKMKAFPVGMSLYSSAISTIAMIGIPVEVYYYGTGYITGVVGLILGLLIVWVVFLPVFSGNLNIKTPYEYFERRYNNNTKLACLFIYIIHTLLMMPAVLYASSVTMNQITNIHLLGCTAIIGGFCTLYTTLGGFKTVIWTDCLQATLMLLSYLFVALAGVYEAKGFSEVWRIAKEGNRFNSFNMTPNPFVRISFWSVTIGMAFISASHSGSSAGALQRYMSVTNENQAKISSVVGIFGSIFNRIIGGITGLAMYALYINCDPVKNKEVASPDQLLPYYVTNTIQYIPGFSGFFIAGLLSAALSTMSSELNVVGGIIYYDVVLRFYKNKFTKNKGLLIIKLIILINGFLYMIPVVFLQKSKHIYEVTVTIGGITYGTKLGMFFLGILFPKSNSKGVIFGALTSLAIIGWISFGAQYYEVSSFYRLPTGKNCSDDEMTLKNITAVSEKLKFEDIFILYKISYLYYCLLGTIITIVVGNMVSYFTGYQSLKNMDPLLVAPFLRNYIKSKQEQVEEMYTCEDSKI